MKLTIGERAVLLTLMPKEENFETLKMIRKFKESLSLSEEEKATIRWRLEYKCPTCGEVALFSAPAKCGKCDVWFEPTGSGQWDSTLDPNKDVFITPTISTIIVTTLNKMSDKKKLTEELVPLYEKFVVGVKKED